MILVLSSYKVKFYFFSLTYDFQMLILIFFSGMFRRIMNKLDRSTAEKSCYQKFDFHFNRKSKQNSFENNVFSYRRNWKKRNKFKEPEAKFKKKFTEKVHDQIILIFKAKSARTNIFPYLDHISLEFQLKFFCFPSNHEQSVFWCKNDMLGSI